MAMTADDPLGIEARSDDPLGIESQKDDPLGLEQPTEPPPSEFIPRNSMELGAMNARREADVARFKSTLPIVPSIHAGPTGIEKLVQDVRNSPAVTKLIGPAIPISREEAPAADDITRRGILPTFAGIPAQIGNDAGRAVKAGLGDIAATVRGDQSAEGDFGGNLKQLLADKEQPLPIERAMELAVQQDRDNKDFGVSTLAADISLGLADLAPKIAMLEAAPGGMAAKAGAASAVFGFDQQGNFQPKQAAFAAAFPYVTGGASQVADKAIRSAVDRGMTWAGTPAAQKAIHVAANQAAMDGLMVVQDSAELMHLAESDPQEFKRQLAKIIGSNLAFALPEVARKYERIGGGADTPEPTAKTEAPVPPMPTQAAPETVSRFADGAVDPIESALNKLRAEATSEAQPATTETETQNSRPGKEIVPRTSPDASLSQALTDLPGVIADLKAALLNNQLAKPQNVESRPANVEAAPNIENLPKPEEVPPAIMRKGIAEEYQDHPEIAAKNPEILPKIVADEVKADPAAYGSGLIRGSAAEKWADTVIAESQKRVNTGLDPELLAAYAVKGAALIEQGVVDFAAWSAEMSKKFGAKIQPHLDDVWRETRFQVARNFNSRNLANREGSMQESRGFTRGNSNGGGYVGYSMSVRANNAYAEGKLPASKGAKELGISNELFRQIFQPSEWHHTSKHFNATDFFDMPAIWERISTEPEISLRIRNEMKTPAKKQEWWHRAVEARLNAMYERIGEDHASSWVNRPNQFTNRNQGRAARLSALGDKFIPNEFNLQADVAKRLEGKALTEQNYQEALQFVQQAKADGFSVAELPSGNLEHDTYRLNDHRRKLAEGEAAFAKGIRLGNGKPFTTDNQRQNALDSMAKRRRLIAIYENANAAIAGGVAGIKTQLESRGTGTESEASSGRTSRLDEQLNAANQSSISPATERDKAVVRTESRMVNQADKSNVAAVRTEEGSALTVETSPHPAKPVKPADKIEDFLTKAIEATELKQGELLEGVTGAPVWLTKSAANGVLRVVRAAYRATRNVAQSIQAGLDWLHDQKLDGFDEMQARTWLDKIANDERQATGDASKPISEPPERERSAGEVKTALAEAEENLRQLTRASSNPELRKGKTAAEHRQETAVATARYRTIRDELLHHPEYVEEQIANLHKAVSEANEMLKPHDMSVHPEEFPSMARMHEVLSPDQFKRIQELQGQIETAYAEVGRMPKKLVARVQSEMESDGRLPNPKPFMPDAGRSIERVTEWLRSKEVDSPSKSLAERLNLGSRVADAIQGAKTSLQKSYLTAKGIWKAAVESYKSPPKDDDFRHVIKSWIYADQRTGLATHQFVKELVAKVPVTDRRKAMSIWLDANGETGLLKAQEMQVPEEYRKVWHLAQKLTPDEKALAMKIKQDFSDKLDDGIKVGIIDRGREDYGVPQRWKMKPEVGTDQHMDSDRKGTAGRINAKLDPRSPFFSFQREVPSYFDGVMAKGVPENLDIAHLVATYDGAFHKTLSSRGMIAALQEAKAKDGLPVVRISGAANVSKDGGKTYFVDSKAWSRADTSVDGRPYQSLDHSALKGWKLAQKDNEGNPIMVRGDMLIHPDHYAYLKNELGQSALREVPVIRGIMQSQAFLKASKLSASFFHLVTIGEHMASHLVNPFLNGFKIDLKQPDQQLLVRNGLELGMSYPQMAYEEGLASAHSGLFNKIPGLGDFSAKTTDWMFKDYIPAIMMKAGLHALENNRKRYGDKLTPDQVAELTAMQMNAAGGLMNYRLRGSEGNMWGRLGANKTWMDIQRMAMLAPQFLEARARVVGQALKPYGMEQRKMLIMQAGILYIGARVLNQLLDGDPHWTDQPFSVVYKKRAYSIRTIVGDFWHLITDPNSFAAGRLSPLGKVAIEDVAMHGRDLRTGARKEVPIETANPIGRFAQNLVVDLANWLTPVGVEGLLPGARGREQTLAGAALSSIGVGSKKATASGEIYKMAADFNRSSKNPKDQEFQRQRDGGTFAQSAYRKLDSLLDEGDIEGARREIAALKQEGKTAEDIQKRYDRNTHFTGSADREERFKRGLSERDKKVYAEAQKEKEARRQALARAFRGVAARE